MGTPVLSKMEEATAWRSQAIGFLQIKSNLALNNLWTMYNRSGGDGPLVRREISQCPGHLVTPRDLALHVFYLLIRGETCMFPISYKIDTNPLFPMHYPQMCRRPTTPTVSQAVTLFVK